MKLLTVLIGIAIGLAVAAPPAHAGDPTPHPSPTLTPLTENQIRLRVVLDENADGLAQIDEPGIASAEIYGGCGDAISRYTTDAAGYATAFATPGYEECFALQREFGWLPTTPSHFRVDPAQLDRSFPTLFMVHDLGGTVMELRGGVIVDGLPDLEPEFGDQAPPFIGGPASPCVEPAQDAFSQQILIVVGADQRMHCPTPGSHFGVWLNGQTIGEYTFAAGQTVATTFVVGPDSMRLSAIDIDAAIVIDAAGRTTGTNCAVIEGVSGFVPPDSVRVYVMPDELRPGCGAPGRRVVLLRDGQRLAPVLDWRTGNIERTQEFTLQPPVVPPNTGTGDANDHARPALALATLVLGLMALGTATASHSR
jgi:hypothetical protein